MGLVMSAWISSRQHRSSGRRTQVESFRTISIFELALDNRIIDIRQHLHMLQLPPHISHPFISKRLLLRRWHLLLQRFNPVSEQRNLLQLLLAVLEQVRSRFLETLVGQL